ncbi:glycosyl transferase [Streptococcus pneumoniae]|uniref:glycosyltransferase family 4 protein n=1 Tax=Streptococcus pneumoniae TaxID=1313 RepID=UPI0005DC45A8|nr:glycosyltransferase family 4 protein [Streptococcus pneumoniae]CJJ27728.1 glycosyl transferase [Streptococcus pneumoniae]CJM52331.1 glycosyl transferase [Streptococcus pneumoniae]CJQ27881.1 glycosyl transferase [Streptococcus pneumoniae]COF29303.1 glycosyl transferase [Streptococcus pneumoniae]COM05038.1 glycosyl transferase [Streptococcus pneumoniae]
MKKIALVKWIIDGTDGGLKVATNIANELSKKYEVHLISIVSTEEIFFPLSNEVYYKNLSSKKISIRKNFFKAVKLLRKYIKENDIKLLLGIGMGMNSVGIASTIGLDTKFISCDHTNSIIDIDTTVKRFQRYVGAKFADKIITLTTADRKNYINKYKIKPDRVEYIYNWIDSMDIVNKYDIDSKKLITVGRFDSQKGYDYLSKVAINILSSYPDWQWDIYGSGDEQVKQDLITELNKGGILSQVHFKGNVNGTDNIYPGQAIYVMTSRYEGLPLVLLEAKQYGLPIVSFNCPTGPAEIVLDGENGYLIEDFDINQMSQKIIELIKNNDLRLRFSRNAMIDTDKFNKKKIVKQWIELIEKVTGE